MRLRLLIGLLALSRAGLALEVGSARVDVTSTTQFQYHGDNEDLITACDDNYYDLFEKLNVVGSHGPWTASLRLDGAYFFDKPTPSGGTPPCRPIDLRSRYPQWTTVEKASLGYNDGGLDIILGDSYVSFGRGLALSLRKVDELGVDTTLLGAKAILRYGIVEGTLVAGTPNIGNIDETTGRKADEQWDVLGGGRMEVEALDGIRLGGHGVLFAFNRPPSVDPGQADRDAYEERWLAWGPTLDAPRLLPFLGLYLEGVQQRRETPEGVTETGNGAYGTVTVYSGPATVLVEGKAYGDISPIRPRPVDDVGYLPLAEFDTIQYHNMPTAERLLQPLDLETQKDTYGARTRLDWAFSPMLTTFVNYGLFAHDYEDPYRGGLADGTIHDPYAGADVRWNEGRSRFALTAGRRHALVRGDVTVSQDLHVDANLVQVLPLDLAMELHAQDEERLRVQPGEREEYREGSLQAGLKWRSTLTGSLILDFSTAGERTWFPGGSVAWTYASRAKVELFVGSSRGGLKCVSGVCRIFPPFDGARVLATVRF